MRTQNKELNMRLMSYNDILRNKFYTKIPKPNWDVVLGVQFDFLSMENELAQGKKSRTFAMFIQKIVHLARTRDNLYDKIYLLDNNAPFNSPEQNCILISIILGYDRISFGMIGYSTKIEGYKHLLDSINKVLTPKQHRRHFRYKKKLL